MFALPELPYDYEALEPYLDAETMHIHHDRHHAAYVKNLNEALDRNSDLLSKDIEEILKNLNNVPEDIRLKVKNHGGGHANHSLFWELMEPAGGGKPEGKLLEAINKTFGDFPTFKEKFLLAAIGQFGSGWGWLTIKSGKLEIETTSNQDTPLSWGKTPLLLLDVWEHAYYLKYRNLRADYVSAWWNVVNWRKVEEIFMKAG